MLDQVWNQGAKRIALVARTPADARDVMIWGDSGIMACSDPHPRPEHEPTKRRLIWPNGAQAFTYSAAAPSQLRGPQHDAAWCIPGYVKVTTEHGQIRMDSVLVGDRVLTRDGWRRVTAQMLTKHDADLIRLTVSDGSVLDCTPDHRVWSGASWARADSLRRDDVLLAITGTVVIVSVVKLSARADVYDLTVEGGHEFYAGGVLVHNCDEAAAWLDARKGDVLDTSYNNLMLGLRLGQSPRCFITTTPKRVKLIRQIMERQSTVITTDTTYANLMNLAPSFRESVLTTYEGTRIGRQELMGELLTDVEGALWTLENIDDLRIELVAG